MRARAEEGGWRLSGWHTGVHLRVHPGPVSAWAVMSAVAAMRVEGLGPLVERSDGWAGWCTSSQPPSPTALRRITRSMRDLAAGLAASVPDTQVSVGVGTPARNLRGIASTLAQARQAALLASSSTERVAVRAVHDLGASRLLLGWYASGAFQDVAGQVLGPLLEAGDEALVLTLQAYLDRACSAAHTARVLGVHRNTVAQRIARAERLLGVSTANPDARLALQLALRTLAAPGDRSAALPHS